jgi:hypothetical protein
LGVPEHITVSVRPRKIFIEPFLLCNGTTAKNTFKHKQPFPTGPRLKDPFSATPRTREGFSRVMKGDS